MKYHLLEGRGFTDPIQSLLNNYNLTLHYPCADDSSDLVYSSLYSQSILDI